MATDNYYELIEAIKEKILSYTPVTFKYVERKNWIDSKTGFARSAVNLGFSIKIDSLRENDTDFAKEDENVNLLSVNIQFALDAIHDNYLTYIGHCLDAIISLEELDFESYELAPIQPYFTADIIENLYVMDFDNLYFLIRNN